MTVVQSQFREALLNADLPVPEGLRNAKGGPAGARFSVYRNNVVLSLTEALATAFPLLRKLLGGETFARLAGTFVRKCPPTSPLMMFYGEALPEFLEGFEPLQHIGYLPDCARLDYAMRESYHAEDCAKFDPNVLQNGDTGLGLALRLAPHVRLLRSNWPIFDIWRFNMLPDAPKPKAGAQDILITRPEFDPQPQLLPPGAADWLLLMDGGMPLDAACEQMVQQVPRFDLTNALKLALSTQAFANTTTKEN